MRATAKERTPAARANRSARLAPKIENQDLAKLADALIASPRVEVGPPEANEPARDPGMWTSMFGIWR